MSAASGTFGAVAQKLCFQRASVFEPGLGEGDRFRPTGLVEVARLLQRVQHLEKVALPGSVDHQVNIDLIFPRCQVEKQQGKVLDGLILKG